MKFNFTPSLIDGEDNLPLKDIPISTVANIAAILSGPKTDSHSTVHRAYCLLEVALHAQNSLMEGKGYRHGIQLHKKRLTATREENEYERAFDALPSDETGEALPFPFTAGLSKIIGGDKKIRERKFRLYLLETYDPAVWEGRDEHYTSKDAYRTIAWWKKEGIPARFYIDALASFKPWWKRSESERKSRTTRERRAREKAAKAALPSKKPAPAPSPKKKKR